MTLADIGLIHSGLKGKSKADFRDEGSPFVTYMDVFDDLAKFANGSGRVVIEKSERQFQISRGDILFTGSSESLEEVGTTSVVLHDPLEATYLNSFCFAIRPTADVGLEPSYARHVLRSENVRRQIIACGQGVTRINISKSALQKVVIPLPDMAEQARIANLLDKFDALANDISSGLPAEIEARRKQYEHYRNKLLTFEEANA